MVTITIDGQPHQVEAGATVLQVARANGIDIPTLCYHPALRPSGSCRLCAVEVIGRTGRKTVMLACVLKVNEGLSLNTQGEEVDKARLKAFRNLYRMAPQARAIRQLADRFQVDLPAPPDGCIRCRLCIRVCKEIVGAGALEMVKRNGQNFVAPIEGRCIGCGTCANICPTQVILLQDESDARTIRIRDEIIGRHPLETCEGCGRRYATPKFLEYVEKRSVPHPDVKTHHRYCPTCAKLFSDRMETFREHTAKHRLT